MFTHITIPQEIDRLKCLGKGCVAEQICDGQQVIGIHKVL